MSRRSRRSSAAAETADRSTSLDAVPVALIGCDQCGRVTTWNVAARALLGWTSIDVIGRRVLEIVGRDVLTGVGPNNGTRTNSRATRASGSTLDVELVTGGSEIHPGTGDHLLAVLPVEAVGPSHVGSSPRVESWAAAGTAIRSIGGHVQCTVVGVTGLEAVNRGYSRSTGDRVLSEVLGRLALIGRASGLVLRIAGKQFLIVVPADEPIDVASIAGAVSSPISTPLGDVRIGCFVGSTSGDSVSPYVLLDRVDAATRLADARGPGSVVTVPRDGFAVDARRHRLSSLLVDAVARGEITVQYKPIVDLRSGRIVALEAHARWISQELGAVEPAVFIEAAESAGLIHALGHQVLEASLRLVAREQAAGRWHDRQVSVKCSSVQLSDPAWFDGVVDALARHGLCGAVLQLELTDTTKLTDVVATAALMEELRLLGVHIALDDLGSGTANISYLRDLPLDTIKIARRFVTGITSNDADRAVVQSMISLASELGIGVIAKGVTHAEQHFALIDRGCDLAQGAFYSSAGEYEQLPDTVELPDREMPVAPADLSAADLSAADADPWGDPFDTATYEPVDGALLAMSARV